MGMFYNFDRFTPCAGCGRTACSGNCKANRSARKYPHHRKGYGRGNGCLCHICRNLRALEDNRAIKRAAAAPTGDAMSELADALLEVLKGIQWGGTEHDESGDECPACPYCGCLRSEGHGDNCKLEAVLKRAELASR